MSADSQGWHWAEPAEPSQISSWLACRDVHRSDRGPVYPLTDTELMNIQVQGNRTDFMVGRALIIRSNWNRCYLQWVRPRSNDPTDTAEQCSGNLFYWDCCSPCPATCSNINVVGETIWEQFWGDFLLHFKKCCVIGRCISSGTNRRIYQEQGSTGCNCIYCIIIFEVAS